LLLIFKHPFALEFFYFQVQPVILIEIFQLILISFLATSVPSGFLSVRQLFFAVIFFDAKSTAFAFKLLSLFRLSAFCVIIPQF
jgi:hypothetical protein